MTHSLQEPETLLTLAAQITALRTTIADAARLSEDAETQRVAQQSAYATACADALAAGQPIPAKPASLDKAISKDDSIDGAVVLLGERLRALEVAHGVERHAWLESALNAALTADAAKAHDAAQRLIDAVADLALYAGENAAADAMKSLIPVVRSHYAGQFRQRFQAWNDAGAGMLVDHLLRETVNQFPSPATITAAITAEK